MLTKQEIRQLGKKEMMEELQKSRRDLMRSQFDVRNGTSKEVHTMKNLRRYIAQLQTISKEMKLDVLPAMGKAEKTEAAPVKAEEKATAPKKAAPKKVAAAKAPAKKAKPAKK